MKRFLLLSAIALIAAPLPVAAQEKTESVLKKTPAPETENTPIKKWMEAENALIDPLSDKDKESFLILRQKYSLIRVVGIAERDISEAVKSCGKKNPDMKSTMEGRFQQWKSAVNPIIDTAKKTFERDLANQKIVDPKEAKKVLKLNDEAYEYGEKQITKTPVSTKEACEGLLASMDRTEDNMIKILQQSLLPESAIRAGYEQEQKAKAKEDVIKKKNFNADAPKAE